MGRLGQRGIATIAAVVAVVAVAGAAVGTPIAVDEIDTNPNSPFYSLERMGERIKEATYAGGVSWNLQRAKERTREYRAVARDEVPNDHLNLLEDAGNCMSKALKGIDSGKELQKVKETLQFHRQVLNEIRGGNARQGQRNYILRDLQRGQDENGARRYRTLADKGKRRHPRPGRGRTGTSLAKNQGDEEPRRAGREG
ncbi:hypothetical protein AKJ41_00200 [candidate division MSBL1 archaeon SCGC-AAA259O05]|uniref:DUF5667 domain-containing protein n=1 Tax=candidate division MSBL1 archaeon SCGC-AAA259O05 TaxID=1698271 RepID=A0A133V5V3_9EURY|nr:hypothetical protein AKJ41_00200 [candidate division MSBL1 archaeon SCGC-AAA259O05]